MSDQIPNAYDESKVDRSELNLGSENAKNKKLALIVFGITCVVIIVVAAFFMVKTLTKDEVVTVDQTTNNNAAITQIEQSKIDDNNFFDALKEKKEREKRQREMQAARDARLAKSRAEEEARRKKFELKKNGKAVTPPKAPPIVRQPAPRVPTPQQRGKAPMTPEQRKLNATVMLPLGSGGSKAVQAEQTDNSFNVKTFANGNASYRGRNGLDFLLIHGSSIPCALYTQIISDYEGFVTCRVTQDVYSANGAVLLIERGSMVSGRQRVALEQGKSRLFTSWADIETPLGVSIKIDSLGAGRLGATGSEAWIDNHYMQRFGGAILLSIIDDGLKALAERAKRSDSGVTYDSSEQTGSSIAEKALESSINIKPTGYSKIGQRINIIVARDIDFSSVYQVE